MKVCFIWPLCCIFELLLQKSYFISYMLFDEAKTTRLLLILVPLRTKCESVSDTSVQNFGCFHNIFVLFAFERIANGEIVNLSIRWDVVSAQRSRLNRGMVLCEKATPSAPTHCDYTHI